MYKQHEDHHHDQSVARTVALPSFRPLWIPNPDLSEACDTPRWASRDKRHARPAGLGAGGGPVGKVLETWGSVVFNY